MYILRIIYYILYYIILCGSERISTLFSRFDTTPACGGQTDEPTDWRTNCYINSKPRTSSIYKCKHDKHYVFYFFNKNAFL